MTVIRFIRDKYYKDKTFEEISAFIMKDSSSFNKALNVVYSDSYSNNVEYPNFEDFKLKYYQLKGNPFKKAGGKIENNDPINDLWKMLKSDNIPVSDNLDEFRSDMQDPSMRKELYNYLYDKRLYRKKFNDFENQYPTLEQTKATSPNDLKWTNKNNQDILLETLQKQIDSISLLKDRVLSEKLTTETQYIEDHKKVNTIYSQQIQISFKLFIIALCLIFGVRYIYHAIKWSIITLKQ